MLELGKSLALECTVRGHPIHQVVFRHNGRIIKSISGQTSSLYGTNTNQHHLIRKQWQAGSSSAAPGSYFVVDSNTNGASSSSGQVLELNGSPPNRMNADEKAELSRTGGASERLKQQGNISGETNADDSASDEDTNEIKLSHVIVIVLEPQHAGAYQCFAYNQYESVQSSAYIRVLDDPPKFKDTFKSGVLDQRQDISLLCSARANPLPEITWSVDDQPIPDTGRSHFGDYVAKVSEWEEHLRLLLLII